MKLAPATDIRKRELAQIHIAKHQLGLDDDTYRTMLWTVARVKSASDLDWAGRKRVLDHLKSRGWTNSPARRAKQSRPLSDDQQSKKIRAMWLSLHEQGIVRDPSETALAGWVKRMTGINALQWLSNSQASKVIEELKKWQMRAG